MSSTVSLTFLPQFTTDVVEEGLRCWLIDDSVLMWLKAKIKHCIMVLLGDVGTSPKVLWKMHLVVYRELA